MTVYQRLVPASRWMLVRRRDWAGIGLLSMSHLVDDLYQGALPGMLPFLVVERHISVAAAGSLVFAANLTSSIGQPFYGHIADRGRAPWLPPLGLAFAGIGLGLAGLAHGYWWIFAAVALSGLGVDVYHPGAARAAHFAARAGEREAARYSIFALGGSIGFALGPLLAVPVISWLGLPGMTLLALPAVIVAVLLARGLAPAPAVQPLAATPGQPSPNFMTDRSVSLADERSRRGAASAQRDAASDQWWPFARVTAAVFLRSIAFFGMITYLPLWWVTHLHHSSAAADAAVTAFMAAGVVGILAGGVLADRYGRARVATAGFLAATPLMLAYLALASSPFAAALLLPAGIALYIPFSVLVGLGQLYLPSRPGVAGGVTLGLASSVGGLAGPVLGWIASEHGLTASLLVVALVPIAAALCAATLRSARR